MLENHDLVAVAVIGVEDERMGEVGMAFVVARENASISENELIRWCRDKMANYKVPRYVEVVDSLPMNPIGKVQKFILRQRASLLLEGRTKL